MGVVFAVVGTVTHALLIEGTMGQVSKAVLCLLVLALIVLTSDASPQWIYQGF